MPTSVHTPTNLQRPLILASSSVYRAELLRRLALPFSIDAQGADIDESLLPDEAPAALAMRLAHGKAQAVSNLHTKALVLGSDQVADLNGQALGKPGNHAKATQQLRAMRGQVVIFQTAVALHCLESGFAKGLLATVRVRFLPLSDAEIETYLLAEKPYDCAGSAKSEGLGIALLASIESDDPTALIGLPLIRTSALLREAGLPPLG